MRCAGSGLLAVATLALSALALACGGGSAGSGPQMLAPSPVGPTSQAEPTLVGTWVGTVVDETRGRTGTMRLIWAPRAGLATNGAWTWTFPDARWNTSGTAFALESGGGVLLTLALTDLAPCQDGTEQFLVSTRITLVDGHLAGRWFSTPACPSGTLDLHKE